MDELDRQLIALLRDDARMSIAALAKELKVARGTVQNRLARLEKDGVIVGYTVRLKPQVEAHLIRAWMTIAVEGNKSQAVLRAFGAILRSARSTARTEDGISWPSCAPRVCKSSTALSRASACSKVSRSPRPASCYRRTKIDEAMLSTRTAT